MRHGPLPEGRQARQNEIERRLDEAANNIGRLNQLIEAVAPPVVPPGATSSASPFGGRYHGDWPVVSLISPLYRTISATAYVLDWDGSGYTNTGNIITVNGTFVTGYYFAGDYLTAKYAAKAGRWEGVGTGQVWIEGKLDATLNLDSFTQMSVYHGATDTGVNVPYYASKLMAAALDADTWVHASWHEALQHWRHSGNEC